MFNRELGEVNVKDGTTVKLHNNRAAAPSQGLELNSGNDIIPEYLKSKAKQSFKKHPQTKLLHFLVHEGVYADVYNFADNSLIRSLLFLI